MKNDVVRTCGVQSLLLFLSWCVFHVWGFQCSHRRCFGFGRWAIMMKKNVLWAINLCAVSPQSENNHVDK